MKTIEIASDSYVKVSIREKIGYGFGDLASNLSFGFVSLFLLSGQKIDGHIGLLA
ncbi:hypothetical protein [uncultured Cedecea sp.]|uniref:hypothetical protein n=1 Tax=uncultured Cedecea sp. TaxID=988762 RepID=UPI0026271200|nr:hypothetical protein [uncultured Cedecea sp.]